MKVSQQQIIKKNFCCCFLKPNHVLEARVFINRAIVNLDIQQENDDPCQFMCQAPKSSFYTQKKSAQKSSAPKISLMNNLLDCR